MAFVHSLAVVAQLHFPHQSCQGSVCSVSISSSVLAPRRWCWLRTYVSSLTEVMFVAWGAGSDRLLFTAQMSFMCFLWMKTFAMEETLTLFHNDFRVTLLFPTVIFLCNCCPPAHLLQNSVSPNLPNTTSDRLLIPLPHASPVLYSENNQHFVFLLTSHSLILNILQSQI